MKKWMVLPLLAVLLLMPVRTVYAAKQTVEIELTEACDDCIFSIVWEPEEQTARGYCHFTGRPAHSEQPLHLYKPPFPKARCISMWGMRLPVSGR